jgi:hypothetical protein
MSNTKQTSNETYYMLIARGSRGDILMKSIRIFKTLQEAIDHYINYHSKKTTEPRYLSCNIYMCSNNEDPKSVVSSRELRALVHDPEYDDEEMEEEDSVEKR